MPPQKSYYVYLLSNWNNKVLYIGVTSDLESRIHEHRYKLIPGFTEKYNVSKLVYYEQTSDVISAISREKSLKSGGGKRRML
jgi:putative endonuclease